MKKTKKWDKCRICGEKFEKAPSRLWCDECRKDIDKELIKIGVLFPKHK